ncbi:MAG: helix-turn-helix domain-containing protein [Actinomycetota bacterium]
MEQPTGAQPVDTAPTGKRAAKKAHNRAALIEAARELMIRDGYRDTLLDAVAERVGLTKGAIYSIFGGKGQLLGALIEAGAVDVGWPALDEFVDRSLDLEDQAATIAAEWARLSGLRVPLSAHAFALEVASLTLRDPELFDAQAERMTLHVTELSDIFEDRTAPSGAIVTRTGADVFAGAFAALMQGLSQRAFNNPSERSTAVFVNAAIALCRIVDQTPGGTEIP